MAFLDLEVIELMITKDEWLKAHAAEPRRVCFSRHAKLKETPQENWVGRFELSFWESVGPVFEKQTGLELFRINYKGFWRSIKSPEEFRLIENWTKHQGDRTFLRDLLDLSVALDQNFDNPDALEYTMVGRLEHDTKNGDQSSIDRLATMLANAAEDLPFYCDAPLVCGVPAHPDKNFDLPTELAQKVAAATGKTDITGHFVFGTAKKSLKELSLDERWDAWEQTGLTYSGEISGQNVILIDDKYQSGITAHFVASVLQKAGAGQIYGLFPVKTLRDTDND